MFRSSSLLVYFQLFLLGFLMFSLSSKNVAAKSSIDRQLQHDAVLSHSLMKDLSSSSSSSHDSDDQIHLTNIDENIDDNDMVQSTSINDPHRMIRAGYAAGNTADNRLWAIPYRFGKRSAMPYRFGKRGAAMHFRLGKKSISL